MKNVETSKQRIPKVTKETLPRVPNLASTAGSATTTAISVLGSFNVKPLVETFHFGFIASTMGGGSGQYISLRQAIFVQMDWGVNNIFAKKLPPEMAPKALPELFFIGKRRKGGEAGEGGS